MRFLDTAIKVRDSTTTDGHRYVSPLIFPCRDLAFKATLFSHSLQEILFFDGPLSPFYALPCLHIGLRFSRSVLPTSTGLIAAKGTRNEHFTFHELAPKQTYSFSESNFLLSICICSPIIKGKWIFIQSLNSTLRFKSTSIFSRICETRVAYLRILLSP